MSTDTIRAAAYGSDHWSHWAPTSDNLARYVALNRVPYNALKVHFFDALLGDPRGLRILDYGGGAGYYAVRCAERGAFVTLIDAEPGALELARRLAADRRVADRLTTAAPDDAADIVTGSRFDVVILKDVIEHVQDDVGLVRTLAAGQTQGARLLLSTHNAWSLNRIIEGSYRRWWCGERNWCGWDDTHVRFYTPASITRCLRAGGYRPLRWAGMYLVPWSLPGWLLLLRRQVEWPWLASVDRHVGRAFPFNRLGWNVVVEAGRTAR